MTDEPLPVPNGGVAGPSYNNALGVASSSTLQPTASQRRRARPDTEEIKRTGRLHYEELLRFLRSHLTKAEFGGPRSNAREKLTRLSKQQFAELSTDVYDELMRRQNNARLGTDSPHLEVREEFHPKRNQARQKLATLPKTRFKDLGSDVFFELERRFPELKEEYRPEAAARDRQRVDDERMQAQQKAATGAAAASMPPPAPPAAPAATPSSAVQAQPSREEEIIPAKSTLVEESIAVPYSNAPNADTTVNELTSRNRSSEAAMRSSFLDDAESVRDSVGSGINGKIGGLSGLGALARKDSKEEQQRGIGGGGEARHSTTSSIGTGFLNGYAASTVASASPQMARASQFESTNTSMEKLRSDYEYRIATLQQRLGALETQNAQLKDSLEGERSKTMEKEAIIGELRDVSCFSIPCPLSANADIILHAVSRSRFQGVAGGA